MWWYDHIICFTLKPAIGPEVNVLSPSLSEFSVVVVPLCQLIAVRWQSSVIPKSDSPSLGEANVGAPCSGSDDGVGLVDGVGGSISAG